MISLEEYYRGRSKRHHNGEQSTLNDLDFSWLSDHLDAIARRAAATHALGSQTYRIRPVLQFEGLDFRFIHPHFKVISTLSRLRNPNKSGYLGDCYDVDFAGSRGKSDCIKNHERAINYDVPISTFVDMDFDYSDISLKEMENIRSSSPYACLRSWILETSNTTDEAIEFILEETENKWPGSFPFKLSPFEVQEKANSITLDTMRRGASFGRWGRYTGDEAKAEWENSSERCIMKVRWFNDHALAEAVRKLSRLPNMKSKKIEKICDAYISRNCSRTIQNLLKEMLLEIGIKVGNEF